MRYTSHKAALQLAIRAKLLTKSAPKSSAKASPAHHKALLNASIAKAQNQSGNGQENYLLTSTPLYDILLPHGKAALQSQNSENKTKLIP